ncbi:hypothetical protein BT93_E1234 [Corymbia citriodora subsp. variegata]|nr:hypothetical protein BT93_E1234 [Corymbia citriodora subsp. variegata]
MMAAASSGEGRLMEEAVAEFEASTAAGYAHAQSALGFLYGTGQMRERSKGKAFLYHHFAAEGGNMQSKMALAYSYMRQDMYEKAVKLYAELAEVAVNSLLITKDSPFREPIRIHNGAEENKEALRKSRGEDDEDFQILEYQAQKGNAIAMYKVGLFYYLGLKGLRRDHTKALSWFLKAVEKGEPRSMELLGEIYARGAGVERNYTKAFEWLKLASRQQLYSAYIGMGCLYVKGYGVEKNYTKAKEYFERAADNEEAGGHYNLGVMYLKGIGVKRDVKLACKYFIVAANAGQPKAFYQLAKMFHTGVGLKKNLAMATALYKLVAERGPWGYLSRWALESYLKGDVGRHSSCTQGWPSWAMRWRKLMLHGFLTSMVSAACAWGKQDFVQMQNDTNDHIIYGRKLLSKDTRISIRKLNLINVKTRATIWPDDESTEAVGNTGLFAVS